MDGWKSPKMQSFGIKIERIDRDLLCIYETNAKWASVHICSVKWAEAKGDLDLRFKVVLWKPLHNATINTRVVEGGPKTLTRACYRALFDVVNRIRSIDHHACDPRIQNCRRVK